MKHVATRISFGLVLKHFDHDFEKAYRWWCAPNPMLGYISAQEMCMNGREDKLLKWIKNQIRSNQ